MGPMPVPAYIETSRHKKMLEAQCNAASSMSVAIANILGSIKGITQKDADEFSIHLKTYLCLPLECQIETIEEIEQRMNAGEFRPLAPAGNIQGYRENLERSIVNLTDQINAMEDQIATIEEQAEMHKTGPDILKANITMGLTLIRQNLKQMQEARERAQSELERIEKSQAEINESKTEEPTSL